MRDLYEQIEQAWLDGHLSHAEACEIWREIDGDE